jgi:acetoin utilization deacetylase AcuC-like enzyme
MYKTGVVRDPLFVEHNMGPNHPESPKRLIDIYQMLDADDMAGKFTAIPLRQATREEICWIHNESYYDKILSTQGQAVQLDLDTSTSPKSVDAALTAVGGCLNAVDAVMTGEVDNAYCLVRPPGHHAEAHSSKGFCIFNNIAIAAEHAFHKHGCKKIAVVDWDLHHGNGTQNSFWGDGRLLYCSTHQYPFFPGSGSFDEIGWKEGEGFTVNIPLSGGCDDGDYVALYERLIRPICTEFNPDLLLISSGYDISIKDPLGSMKVTTEGFDGILDQLMKVAESCCAGKFLVFLEGGYNVEAETAGVKKNLELMRLRADQRKAGAFTPGQPSAIDPIVKHLSKIFAPYWSSLKS